MTTETKASIHYSLAALYNESVSTFRNDQAIRQNRPATEGQKNALREKLAKADGEALGSLVKLFRDYFNDHRENGTVITGWEVWSAQRSLDLAMNTNAYQREQAA